MPHILEKKDRTQILLSLKKMFASPPSDVHANLLHVTKKILAKKKRIRAIAKKYETPCYIIDAEELEKNINSFKSTFSLYVPNAEFFYALKTNPHPFLLNRVINAGFGLDIASSTELHLGLAAKAKKFVFSGPGKTNKQLEAALTHRANVIINIDSFGELDRLGTLTNRSKKRVRCGVRIHTDAHGEWQKFGIPIHDLKKFWKRAYSYSYLSLEGIHFHTSLNENALPYVTTIQCISEYLNAHFSKKDLRSLTFIDMGGGFYPHKTDGYYPWTIPVGEIAQTLYNQKNAQAPFMHKHYRVNAVPIDSYAHDIGQAIKKYLVPLVHCSYYFEPGRIISSTAMHILLSVVDVKSPSCAIMDGGNNMIGWERLSYDYFPVINITHPSTTERAGMLYGSLCMSGDYDSWGRYYYGSKLAPGDILVVPYQGHLTYALAQNFIHPIPPVYIMK